MKWDRRIGKSLDFEEGENPLRSREIPLKRYQIGCALFLFLIGIFVSWEGRGLDVGRVVSPGPGFFPFWLGLALIIVSLALLFHFGRKKVDPSLSSQDPWKGFQWEKVLYSSVALLLYALFLETLGYLLATVVLMLFFFRAIEPQKWVVVIPGSVITSFITYLLFKVWLQVHLPAGLWGM